MKKIEVDVAVIGHGTAGGNAFRAARAKTDSVVTIEGHVYGTTCARVGCMPSKLLIAAADAAHEARHAEVFGVRADVHVDGKAVMKRVRDMRDWFVGFVVADVEEIPDENRIRGMAQFISEDTLQVDDHTQVTAKSFVIATGSTPFVPEMLDPVKGFIQTSDDIFYWDDLPESVAVFGTGVIAMELGQALSRLGVRTTIFGNSGRVGGLSGPGMQDVTRSTFWEELDLVSKPEDISVDEVDGKAQITFIDTDGKERVEVYETILAATGRRTNTDKIGLSNTSVLVDERGVPVFDKQTLQCGNAPVFIAGDVMATHALLHEASDEGKVAGENAALAALGSDAFKNLQRRENTMVVFTSPQIAIAGKSYQELDPEAVVIGIVDMTRQGRAQVMAVNKGMIQVYIERESRKLVGAELLSPRAEHFAHLLSWMIQKGATIDEIIDMPFYHPTFEEGLRTAFRNALSQLEDNK